VPALLDATDTRKRFVQHGAIVAAVALLLVAIPAARADNLSITAVLIGAGLAMFGVTALTSQRWTVDYHEHRIVLENNPLRGEKLLVDGVLAAKGKIGFMSEMRATIASGTGAGDQIVARTEAGLFRYRCSIHVDAGSQIPLSDEALWAELQRRRRLRDGA
jgi:hypothetical protein